MREPQTLPHDAEAENAVCGGILLRGKEALADVLDVIDEEDMYQPRTQAVLRAMRILDERGEPLDVITLADQLRRSSELELVGGIEGIARLDRFATAHNIRRHAEIVRDRARVRETVVAAREIAAEGMDQDLDDAEAYCEAAVTRMRDAAAAASSSTYVHARPALLDVFHTITELQREGAAMSGCPTGFHALDDMTDGLQPTDLIILAARPSMGKTAMALNLATEATVPKAKHLNAAAIQDRKNPAAALAAMRVEGYVPYGWPVLIFSLEMSTEQLLTRVICSEAQVDSKLLKKPGAMMESDFKALIAAADRVSRSGMYIDDSAAISITALTRKATRWADKHCQEDPDGRRRGLIMVDYLQLMTGKAGKNYKSREPEVADISRGLKALAKTLKMPVVALAQLNRAADSRADHRPNLSDLRESGAIEQDADVIMFLYRAERYLPADPTDEQLRGVQGKADLIVSKHRGGDTGTVPLVFVKRHTKFQNPALDYEGLGYRRGAGEVNARG